MVEPPPLPRGPSGGNSTLTLAPLPDNHPQSVFQSVPLLFNYPFKACNLLLRGTDSTRAGHLPAKDNENDDDVERRPGERTTFNCNTR